MALATTTPELCQLAKDHGLGIPPNLIVALIMEESGGQPGIISSAGAVGLMQIVARLHVKTPGDQAELDAEIAHLKDPVANIDQGCHILLSFYNYINNDPRHKGPGKVFPDWNNERLVKRALASYNWGPGNVIICDQQGKQWREPVQRYADNIWGLYMKAPCG